MAAQGRNTKRLAGLQVGPAESSGCRWKNQQARPTCTDQQAASTNRQTSTCTSTDCTFSDPPFFRGLVQASTARGGRSGRQVVLVAWWSAPRPSFPGPHASAAPALRRPGRAGREAPPRSAYADGSRRSERHFSSKISPVRRGYKACDCCPSAENFSRHRGGRLSGQFPWRGPRAW